MVQTCCVGRTVDGNYNAYTVVTGVIARHHVFLLSIFLPLSRLCCWFVVSQVSRHNVLFMFWTRCGVPLNECHARLCGSVGSTKHGYREQGVYRTCVHLLTTASTV